MAQLLTRRLLMSAPGWRGVFESAGVKVFAAGANGSAHEPCLLSDHAGIALGTLFARAANGEAPAQVRELSPGESEAIVASAGRRLIERYWGHYVALVRDAETDRNWVLRDPTGGLPCLTATLGGVQLYFSQLEDCAQLEMLSLTVNWPYVTTHLAAAFTCGRETGLREVTEVAPGECLEISHQRVTRSLYWHPLSFAPLDGASANAGAGAGGGGGGPPGGTAKNESPVHFDVAARASVHAWAARYRSVLCLRDGGHHSTLLFELLRSAPNHPTVVGRQERPHLSLEELLREPRTERPVSWLGRMHTTSAGLLQAWDLGAEAVFCATGAELLLRASRGVSAHRALVDTQAFREASLHPPPVHPWFRPSDAGPADVAPGGLFHRVRALLAALHVLQSLAQSEDLELVAPLLSQPLIELVMRGGAELATPPAGARDDARARAVLQRNLPLVRAYLMDGILLRERLLDRRRLEAALAEIAQERPLPDGVASEILDHFSTEAWLASWLDAEIGRQRERRVEVMW
jgi:hypothetical protein